VELLEAHLIAAGYEVAVAYDGKEALEKIFQETPDLVLLDIMMPKIDGYEVCRRTKENDKTKFIPIIMITALTEVEDKIKGIEVGADDFMNKPINKIELLTRVRSLLRIKNLHDQLEKSYREIEVKNQIMSNILNRYIAGEVVKQVVENPQKYLHLGGEDKVVTVIFADIRGFTGFTTKNPAQKVVNILNSCFSKMTENIFHHKGTFDKYMGDSIMTFFGAPISYEDDAIRALRTAVEMRDSFETVKKSWNDKDFNRLGLGIGINTGKVVVGNVGSERVMDYTVIGNNVNIARRLQEHAPKGAIIISDSTYSKVKEKVIVKKLLPISLKGVGKDIIAHELLRLI
jgi:class 3 adenylate cyclase